MITLGRTLDHLCFVVRDLDEAIESWRQMNGIDAWYKAIGLSNNETEKEYWGNPGNFEFSCAYGGTGAALIELARHDGGDSLYGDWLDEHGPGLHHIGLLLADADEYTHATSHYVSLGLDKAMGGFFRGPIGDCRWSYWDTRAEISCYTELYYVDGALVDRMERMKAGDAVTFMA